jgi:hypothetical protein
MSERDEKSRFESLPAEDQERYREFGQQMVGRVRKYVAPIVFAPPPGVEGEINSASCAVLKLDVGYFAVTAHHVLDYYRKRAQSEEKINWQIGNLPPLDPLPRIRWEDADGDTALLSLSSEEARHVGACVIVDPIRWPPPKPTVGQLVLVAGFLKVLREVRTEGFISVDGLAAMFRIESVGDGYCYCRYERERIWSVSMDYRYPKSARLWAA